MPQIKTFRGTLNSVPVQSAPKCIGVLVLGSSRRSLLVLFFELEFLSLLVCEAGFVCGDQLYIDLHGTDGSVSMHRRRYVGSHVDVARTIK
jgi:hypothetical protein